VASADLLEARIRKLERQVRWQLAFGAIALVALGILVWTFTMRGVAKRIIELDVERLNVVEPNGELVLTLANTKRLPDPLIAGKTVETGRTGPGLIFFDGKGWEIGGLTYGTRVEGEGYNANGHFSFDQFHNDQVVFMSYQDDGQRKSAGLHVVDRARTPTIDEILKMQDGLGRAAIQERLQGINAERVFVGSDNETAMLRLRDLDGRDRIRLSVDREGVPRLEFLNESGQIVDRLPR
jgi:hypothetical protein